MSSYYLEMSQDEPIRFWKSLFLVISFFVLTPIALISSLVALVSINPTKTNTTAVAHLDPKIGAQVYASLPSKYPTITASVGITDARAEIVRQYLQKYNSPLVPYAQKIVDTEDKYGLDFRLIPAIAQQESNLCHIIPYNSHNCWGWGITSESSLAFSSYDEAIETVSKGLKENYIDKGYLTPDQIMKKYTPSSPGSWAKGVNEFMANME